MTKGAESAPLRIGFAPSTVAHFPHLLRLFCEREPRIAVELVEGPSQTQPELVLNGIVDIGIAREPPAVSGVDRILLKRERYNVALPAGHRLARRRTVAVRELAHEPFVHFPPSEAPALHAQVLKICESAGFTPRVGEQTTQWTSLIGLVAADLGVAIVPESFRAMEWEGVRYAALRPAGPVSQTMLCARHDSSEGARRFIEVAVANASPSGAPARSAELPAQRSGGSPEP